MAPKEQLSPGTTPSAAYFSLLRSAAALLLPAANPVTGAWLPAVNHGSPSCPQTVQSRPHISFESRRVLFRAQCLFLTGPLRPAPWGLVLQLSILWDSPAVANIRNCVGALDPSCSFGLLFRTLRFFIHRNRASCKIFQNTFVTHLFSSSFHH
ncbi:hypothetical protein B0J13DRAFT_124829 [Dactylonectria estremocensis]|uniref:Uncharacterized protein n=1 Tax=Dactylonectria estremocensis TaxID=1079267 RepID=A0A9P9JCF5_9HYPO|nr:hypothetical protein B0J13DRAFT_124829 [Dactylonectria estremocensis]